MPLSKAYKESASEKSTQRNFKKKKPDWDETVNDLTVHKATSEELARRKAVAQSQNVASVKDEKLRKRISRARSGHDHRSMHGGLHKEFIGNGRNLSDTLSKSDKLLAVVQDLFGDDPFKYQGNPNITDAPRQPKNKQHFRFLPDSTSLEATRLDQLSGEMMDRQALNDDSDESFSEDSPIEYVPGLNMEQFRKLLERAAEEEDKLRADGVDTYRAQKERKFRERKKSNGSSKSDGVITTSVNRSQSNSRDSKSTGQKHHRSSRAQSHSRGSSANQQQARDECFTPERERKNHAINDTIKVKRSRSRRNESSDENEKEAEEEQQPCDLNALNKVLGQVEKEIAEYEKNMGRHHSSKEDKTKETSAPTLTGFTGRLVVAIHKMSSHLRECERQVQNERHARQRLEETVSAQGALLDALTQDILALQEEHSSVNIRLNQYSKKTDDKLTALETQAGARGDTVESKRPASVTGAGHGFGDGNYNFAPLTADRPASAPFQQAVQWQELLPTRPGFQQSGHYLHPTSSSSAGAPNGQLPGQPVMHKPLNTSLPSVRENLQQASTLPWQNSSAMFPSENNFTHSSNGLRPSVPHGAAHFAAPPTVPSAHPSINQQDLASLVFPNMTSQMSHPHQTNGVQQAGQTLFPANNAALTTTVNTSASTNFANFSGQPPFSAGQQQPGVNFPAYDLTEREQLALSQTLTRQIEELNRKHVEAQNKLFMLVQQSQSGTSLNTDDTPLTKPSLLPVHSERGVSPAISPILSNEATHYSTELLQKVQTAINVQQSSAFANS